jgi:hypothetical protein
LKSLVASVFAVPADDKVVDMAGVAVVGFGTGEPEPAGGAEPPSDPVMPPVAPVAAMRAAASALVVQVTEVPAELTRGRAAQINELAQGVVANLPFTHCAKLEPTQAFCPSG